MADRSVAASLSAYEPSWRERVGNATYDIARYLGLGSTANRMRNDVEAAIDFVPFVGDAIGFNDAVRDISAGNYGAGAAGLGLAALGGIPIAGDVASKAGKKIVEPLYRGSHLAPIKGSGAPLHALDDVGSGVYGGDIYSNNAMKYYGSTPEDAAVLDIANQYRGAPDKMVTIYRSIPNDIENAAINPGDWVSLKEEYARLHGDARFGGNYNVVSKEVPAREVYTSGDSLQEWGWSPEGYTHTIPDAQEIAPRPAVKSNSPVDRSVDLRWEIPELEGQYMALSYARDAGYNIDKAIEALRKKMGASKLKGLRQKYQSAIEVLDSNREKIENVIGAK